jgi:hypothetical protein
MVGYILYMSHWFQARQYIATTNADLLGDLNVTGLSSAMPLSFTVKLDGYHILKRGVLF